MNGYKLTLSLALGCLVFGFTAMAQQSPPAKKRTPLFTSEDLSKSQSQSGQTVVLTAVEPTAWGKVTPGDLHLSLDIPGGLDLNELPIPDYVQNELHREYGEAKSYIGGGSSQIVFVMYLPSNKASVSPAELRTSAAQFMKVLTRDPSATGSTELTGKSKVSMKASYTYAGERFELLGTMQSRGKEIWLVTSVFRQFDETARKIALRIVGSATLFPVAAPAAPKTGER